MRSIVLGGAGFVGSHLVDRLLARGDEVVAAATVEEEAASEGGEAVIVVDEEVSREVVDEVSFYFLELDFLKFKLLRSPILNHSSFPQS